MSAENIKDSLERLGAFSEALKEEFDFEKDGFSLGEKYRILSALARLLEELCQKCEVPYSMQLALSGRELHGKDSEVAHLALSGMTSRWPADAVLLLFSEHLMKLRRDYAPKEQTTE